MRAFLILGTIAGLLSGAASAQQCLAPPAPGASPSGASATREQMLSAQSAIKDYNTAVTAYTDCMKKIKGSQDKIDAAVIALERLADRFNAELRVFKQRNSAQ
jgi:hypothetical protein